MTLENPIIGVGLDSYGDWYRRSRTLEATLRRGPDVTSNAAHNVYLDISSYGGFPLLFLYVALMALVVVSAIKVLKREKSFNPGFVGLVAAWIAFQAQSIISINQIGLAIWGWVISGLIIGYEVNTRSALPERLSKDAKRGSQSAQISNSSLIGVIAGFVIGVLAGMPPYMASAKFKGALETGDSRVVESAAYIWPKNALNMVRVSKVLNDNELGPEGLKVALDAVERFPDNYAVWANLNSMNSASEKQKAEALLQMKRLDPLNPNLK
jgi:O-antigen ligase